MAEATARERQCMIDRIADLASQLQASFPADYPNGARASFADYLRTYARGDLLADPSESV